MDELEDDREEDQQGGIQADQIASYARFARRAIRERWRRALVTVVIGIALTFVTLAVFPKTFECRTALMALGSSLDRSDGLNPMAGAEGLILRHENLEAIVRDTDMVHTFAERRSYVRHLKDRAMAALFGPPSAATMTAILVGTLETKLDVGTEKGQLLITADWTDGQTAAELADAARESFLKARHSSEMSAFEDRMAILDGHATKLRDEIAVLADQLNAAEKGPSPTDAPAPATPAASAPAPRVVRPVVHNPDGLLAEEVASLREKLAADRPKLTELENEWNRRQRDEQAKLAELKLRFTPSHPEVVTQEERVAIASQLPPDVTMLRSEVATIERDIKDRDALAAATRASGGSAAPAAGGAEPLPTAVIQALEKDDADPALRAQLSGAIMKYRDLRDDIRSGRIELDTAQAAFNHRYQLIVPAEVPSKPTKPKPALIVAGGLLVTLLLAGLLPILSELRRGVIIERWQVQTLQLPVLAELELPPHTD